MPWVRIDDEFPHHPKVTTVGPFGVALQVAALCYCNHFLTDGFLPFGAVRTLLDFNRLGENIGDHVEVWVELGAMNIAGRLVKAGIWEEVEGGFRIHDYGDYQPSRIEVEAEREKNRDRVAKHRANKRNKGRNASSNAITNADVRGAPVPVPVPPVGDPGVAGDPIAETDGVHTLVEQARPLAVIPGGFSDDPADILDVWDAWKHATGHQRADFSPIRRKAIVKALNAYPLQDVLDAVRGHVNDPWPERPQHNDITQLLHIGTQRKPLNVLEKMRDLFRDGPPVVMDRRTAEMVNNARGVRAWAEQMEGGRRNGSDGTQRMGTSRPAPQRQLPGPAD